MGPMGACKPFSVYKLFAKWDNVTGPEIVVYILPIMW